MATRIVVAITGASGSTYGIRLLEVLQELGIETHLVASPAGMVTLRHETSLGVADLESRCDVLYRAADIGAAIASGSFRTDGMVVVPCSVRTMSEIASGITSSLVSRAADVTLKERRRLVLCVRETPLHAGHLDTMTRLANLGAVIAPPVPAFYTRPETLDDLVDHTVGRLLDHLGIDNKLVERWSGTADPS
ncbi:MAG: UbiX family flavin prenyltransferase [Propionibacteriaceae bacterium]